jgi:dTMP kinase
MERDKLQQWILDFNFNFLKLPKPDLTIFFDLSIKHVKERLERRRKGSDRNYLNGKADIYEADINFQSKVREVYLDMFEENLPNYELVDCYKDDYVYTPSELFNNYKKLLSSF